jgi:hypothetical protein
MQPIVPVGFMGDAGPFFVDFAKTCATLCHSGEKGEISKIRARMPKRYFTTPVRQCNNILFTRQIKDNSLQIGRLNLFF